MKKTLFIIIFSSLSILIYAQTDVQLALKYFQDKEFAKAENLFDKLYKQKKSRSYFNYYLDCLINQEKFKEAEKRIKKEIKRHPNDYCFYVDLGYLQKKEGKEAQAEDNFKLVLKNLPSKNQEILRIGNSFSRRQEYEWAEKVYIKGNKMFGQNAFTIQLANVYAGQRDYEKMVNSYLDFLENDYSKMATVKNVFRSYMKYEKTDDFSKILERSLMFKIQKTKLSIFEELLVWFYMEKTNFLSALIFAKALDKRKNENGVRVFTIGKKAQENNDYATANKAYSYVIEKGESFPYYMKAKQALLSVMYQQVEAGDISSSEEIAKLENDYLELINQYGISQRTVDLVIDLAHLQAFYLEKGKNAIELLNKSINIYGVKADYITAFLLELGDIYVYAEMPYDAILTYAKLEDKYPNFEITDQAKFNKAKVYFYLGEFQWAKDQWDILKGSPSKLIANDAIYWSHFLDENAGADSLQTALKKYAKADLFLYQRKYNDALLTIDTLLKEFPTESVVPAGFFLKYQIFMGKKKYEKAAKCLEIIAEQYNYVVFADKAVYELAKLYDYQLDNKEKAAEYYKSIFFDYQGSIFTDPSRKRYRELLDL